MDLEHKEPSQPHHALNELTTTVILPYSRPKILGFDFGPCDVS